MSLQARIAALREKREKLLADAETIVDAAGDDQLTAENQAEIDGLMAKATDLETEIGRVERLAEQRERAQTPVGPTAARRQPHIEVNPELRGKGGFHTLGHFAMAVRNALPQFGGTIDPRLIQNAPTTIGSEGVGEDGGFPIPDTFRSGIMQKLMAEETLTSRCDVQYVAGNSVTFWADEDPQWQSSGGIRVYWTGENAQGTQSQPRLKEKTARLNKLMALVPITNEQLDDVGFMTGFLNRKVPEAMDWAVKNAIINGTGAGQPVGILNAACTVSQAKDTSTSPAQAAATVRHRNIVEMWARLYGPCRSRAVWLANPDVETALALAQFSPGSNSPVPVYLPQNNMAGSPFGTLYGKPLMPTEACQALGTVGDLILADLSQYLLLFKSSSGVQADTSMHLWFDYDTMAFRFILRVFGMPWWASAITPPNSANTRSCFVSLATRS